MKARWVLLILGFIALIGEIISYGIGYMAWGDKFTFIALFCFLTSIIIQTWWK